METRVLNSIAEIQPGLWDALFEGNNPFIRHAFLKSLEDSGSVGEQSGWNPRHLITYQDSQPIAAMPMYMKTHSMGEFVFDHGWAQAYARHGLAYYPKLLTAIPFTPSTGPRVGMAKGLNSHNIFKHLLGSIQDYADRYALSGWHLLFPTDDVSEMALKVDEDTVDGRHEMLRRFDVQFHWQNRGYAHFDDFLGVLKSSRRKNLRRERGKVQSQGIVLDRRIGAEISEQEWASFYHCYVATYLKWSGHGGYLNRSFFELLANSMPEQLMMVIARAESEIIACALFLFDDDALYGRYWGAMESIDSLHFETCIYQGIEFCIENKLQRFDPGTQGEHKLLRGFEPVRTTSWHWVANEQFRLAISDFLDREKQATEIYSKQAEEILPYRNQV